MKLQKVINYRPNSHVQVTWMSYRSREACQAANGRYATNFGISRTTKFGKGGTWCPASECGGSEIVDEYAIRLEGATSEAAGEVVQETQNDEGSHAYFNFVASTVSRWLMAALKAR